eukprot:gene26150-32040_t
MEAFSWLCNRRTVPVEESLPNEIFVYVGTSIAVRRITHRNSRTLCTEVSLSGPAWQNLQSEQSEDLRTLLQAVLPTSPIILAEAVGGSIDTELTLLVSTKVLVAGTPAPIPLLARYGSEKRIREEHERRALPSTKMIFGSAAGSSRVAAFFHGKGLLLVELRDATWLLPGSSLKPQMASLQ